MPLNTSSTHNDDQPPVYIILGRVWMEEGGEPITVHIMLKAADDDSAIRESLNALSEDGYAEAEFDQIGTLTDAPIEEPHASAYQGALEGEVAIVTYVDENAPMATRGEEETDGYDADNVHPFEALKDWGKD